MLLFNTFKTSVLFLFGIFSAVNVMNAVHGLSVSGFLSQYGLS